MISIEKIDELKDLCAKECRNLKGFKDSYFDMRIEVSEGIGASAQNGNPLGAAKDYFISIGVKCIYGKQLHALGFQGTDLGENDLEKLGKIIREMKAIAFKKAKANLAGKQKLLKKANIFAEEMEPQVNVDNVVFEAKKNYKEVSIEDLTKRVCDITKNCQKFPEIKSSVVSMSSGVERKLFVNSIGAEIDQTTPLSEQFVFATAFGKGPSDYYATNGAYAGLEVFDGENAFGKSAEQFVEWITEGTAELANAPAIKPQEKESIVVTDPFYNALLVHEICGHPTEADRALKREAAWAGRAWWYHSIEENLLGKQVAAENVSVFSDPLMEGYGNYHYDDEGTKAKKIYNIKNGILNEFLNGLETAKILGKQPNGGMRASSASVVPIIRMNNTCFEAGDWNAEEIIQETREGYYLCGQKIPSIGDTRQNFRITCWKLYEIKNGEIGQLYRMGGMTADSGAYLKSIDAAGKNFQIFPIPNCGKGTPMQTMKVGNGGPTMRGKARITGAEFE